MEEKFILMILIVLERGQIFIHKPNFLILVDIHQAEVV